MSRKQHASDLERRRINSIQAVVFDPATVTRVCNSSSRVIYVPPVWPVRQCDNKAIKSLGGSV